MNNLEKWVWFSEALYKGSRKANELLSHFGDIEKIYTADRTAFKASGVSFGEKELERLLDTVRKTEYALFFAHPVNFRKGFSK